MWEVQWKEKGASDTEMIERIVNPLKGESGRASQD